jgi:pimeloyl-ACP methyl ester carboxylesterase
MARVDSNGVGIEYDVHGSGEGPWVLLLHGFPDSARLWRHQVPALVDAGCRVVVPDLRGFGRSDKPDDLDAYNLLFVAGDVLAVLDDAGIDRAAVVGHDWGAALAWVVATATPDRVERLAVLSVGHPLAFRATGMDQRERSWYMLLFQFEGIAERWLSENGWANFHELFAHPDADVVTAELERDGSLTPALSYYRANVPPASSVDPAPELPPVTVPTVGIWSSGDRHLVEQQMQGSADHCAAGFRYERIDGAGHWMMLDAPDDVNRLLLDFLGRPDGQPS